MLLLCNFDTEKGRPPPTSALLDSNLRRITFLKTLHSDLKAMGSSTCKLFNCFLMTGIVSIYSKKGRRKTVNNPRTSILCSLLISLDEEQAVRQLIISFISLLIACAQSGWPDHLVSNRRFMWEKVAANP